MIELGYRKLYPSVVPGIGTGRSAPGRMQKNMRGISLRRHIPRTFSLVFSSRIRYPPRYRSYAVGIAMRSNRLCRKSSSWFYAANINEIFYSRNGTHHYFFVLSFRRRAMPPSGPAARCAGRSGTRPRAARPSRPAHSLLRDGVCVPRKNFTGVIRFSC